MSEALGTNEGLRILARIIARAYLADTQGDEPVENSQKKVKKGESISGTSRNSFDGKRGN